MNIGKIFHFYNEQSSFYLRFYRKKVFETHKICLENLCISVLKV